MQGLEICSQQESNCSPLDVVTANDIDFGRLGDLPLPEPPQDNNQVAAWYDTDL
jgi:catenin beta 1